jgi:hypothetical protein
MVKEGNMTVRQKILPNNFFELSWAPRISVSCCVRTVLTRSVVCISKLLGGAEQRGRCRTEVGILNKSRTLLLFG